VHIRNAIPNDALAVATVHVRSWQAAFRGLLPDPFLDGLRAEDRAVRYTFGDPAPGRPRTVVAVDGDAIVGFATTGLDEGEAMLHALYVDPDRWGTGAGKQLVVAARHELALTGHREAILWSLIGNTRADRFYAADGWQLDGTVRHKEVWNAPTTQQRYRRALP